VLKIHLRQREVSPIGGASQLLGRGQGVQA
jgi:hypothetical protein